MTIIDEVIKFYAARLEEDEQAAKAAGNRRWLVQDNIIELYPEREDDGFMSWPTRADAQHAARHDPARVLKKVAAGRGLIRLYEDACEQIDYLLARDIEPKGSRVAVESYGNAILLNAAEWDDHEDWRAAWRHDWIDPLFRDGSDT